MDLSGSIDKMLRVAAVTSGLLVLACLQAGPANSAGNQLFSEKWQDQFVCKNTGTKTCKTVSGGSFSLKTTFSGTCLVPSDIEPGKSNSVEIQTSGAFKGDTSTASGIDFTDSDVGDDFGIQVFSNKTVATLSTGPQLTVRVCNPPNTNCKIVSFEKVKLTVNSTGDLTVSVSGTTGKNFNGDMFSESLDAASFVGEPSGDVTDAITFDVTLGCFDSGSVNVAVTGSVKTTAKTSSKPQLSRVNVKGVSGAI